VFADSGSLAAIQEAPPAAPCGGCAWAAPGHLAAGGDHRAHLPSFTHRRRICSGRFMSGRWSQKSQPGWSLDALPVAAGWRYPVRDVGRGERRGQPGKQGNRGQAGIWQAELGDD
jgi:hypothetical protein